MCNELTSHILTCTNELQVTIGTVLKSTCEEAGLVLMKCRAPRHRSHPEALRNRGPIRWRGCALRRRVKRAHLTQRQRHRWRIARSLAQLLLALVEPPSSLAQKREWLGSMHADAAERVLTGMLGCSRGRNGAVRAQAHKGGTEPGVAAANGESPQQRMVRSFQRPSAKKLIAERIAREERDARRFPIQPASGALCIFAAAAGGPPVPLSRF